MPETYNDLISTREKLVKCAKSLLQVVSRGEPSLTCLHYAAERAIQDAEKAIDSEKEIRAKEMELARLWDTRTSLADGI